MGKGKKLLTGIFVAGLLFNGQMNVLAQEVESPEVQTPRALLLRQAEYSMILPDSFRLGIDDYVTGYLDSTVKKVELHVNGQKVSSGKVFTDGTFEIFTEDRITSLNTPVEVVGLDRRGNELTRAKVVIEAAAVNLSAEEYTLLDEQIVGTAGNQMDSVSLVINGDVYRTVQVNGDDTYVMPIEEDEIIESEDHVEIVGSIHGKELARIVVPVNSIDLNVALADHFINDNQLITGELYGKAASKARTVRLYVNRKRYNEVSVVRNNYGTFSFALDPMRVITSIDDDVKVAILDEKGQELGRYQVYLMGHVEQTEQSAPITSYNYEVGHRYEKQWDITFTKNFPLQATYRYYGDERKTQLLAQDISTNTYLETRISEQYKEVFVTVQEIGKTESVPVKVSQPAMIHNPLYSASIKTLLNDDGSWIIEVHEDATMPISQRAAIAYGVPELHRSSQVYGSQLYQNGNGDFGWSLALHIDAKYDHVYVTMMDELFGGIASIPVGGNRGETLGLEIAKPQY